MPILKKQTAYRRKRIARQRATGIGQFLKKTRTYVPLKKIFLALTALLLLFILFRLLLFLTTPISFTCQTQFGDCSQELNNRINLYMNQSYLLTYSKIVNIPDYHQEIKSIRPHLGINRTLDVQVQVENPVVAVTSSALQSHSLFFLASYVGSLITKTTEPNLPTVSLLSVESVPGQMLPAPQITALQIVYHLHQLEYSFVAQQTAPDTLQVTLHSPYQMEILFPLKNENTSETMVSTLQLILTQTKMNLDQVQIDLRYPKPVIRGGQESPDDLASPL